MLLIDKALWNEHTDSHSNIMIEITKFFAGYDYRIICWCKTYLFRSLLENDVNRFFHVALIFCKWMENSMNSLLIQWFVTLANHLYRTLYDTFHWMKNIVYYLHWFNFNPDFRLFSTNISAFCAFYVCFACSFIISELYP